MFVVLDCEVYINYFLATFTFEDGKIIEFERFNDVDNYDVPRLGDIGRMLMTGDYTVVTFNGKRYDMPILSLAMANASNAVLKEASDYIIKHEAMWWHVEKRYNFTILDLDHIDIINILVGVASLKLYGGRNGTAELQDLPFHEADHINHAKAAELRTYCRKDCRVTWELFIKLWDVIQLRITLGQQYHMDLRSKSDAQIAEAVISKEYQRITNKKLIKPIDAGTLPTEIDYVAPAWVQFNDPQLTKLVDRLQFESHLAGFTLHPKNGKPQAPKWLRSQNVKIGGKPYAFRLGGLHAKNKYESYFSQDDKQLIDLDVTSYYPAIILNNDYNPPHMGEAFGTIYGSLVTQRLLAKAKGDTTGAETLKICINGTYGKLGSPYSAVYAPRLMLSVTFTGQLALLMLIEMMAENGIQVVSANTDGVTIMVRNRDYECIVKDWQEATGLNLEETFYKSIHYRDVNNYFALTTEGKVKKKGIFKPAGLTKNPAAPIVFEAVIDNVLYAKSVWETIDRCKDIKKFLTIRTVKGGAAKDGEYLGKAVRWYNSTDTDTAINYISNGNQVAKSMGAMPMMDVTGEFPRDLDYDWYVDEAMKTIDEVGYFGWM